MSVDLLLVFVMAQFALIEFRFAEQFLIGGLQRNTVGTAGKQQTVCPTKQFFRFFQINGV